MPLTTGTRLGVYEIADELGRGGMGEVYRARDTKLGRAVAVKVLPDALASDADRISRFEREAKLLAALNHPHIAALFGMEEADGRHFLVMELVEGETLADRLRRGPLPLEETLRIGQQIAEALEAAHEKGIVHRDLKPANVKITPDEKVKVLDFGLAKAMETERPVSDPAYSPTLSLMATQAGLILGTAAYMSPEQAKGFPADQRSDVFSFGVVLYEMLTGRRPFQGETAPDILASVLVRDPDLTSLPPNLNPRLHDLVRRCLEKIPKRRWQAIGDVRAELETIAADPRGASTVTHLVVPPRPLWRRALPVALAAIAAGVLVGAAVWQLRPATTPIVTRFSFPLAEGQSFTNVGRQLVAISADGTQMVYVANSRLYARPMWEPEPRPIPGTETYGGVMHPVFSPDGRSVAFWAAADRTIKRIALAGGAAVTICQAETPYGMSWGDDGIMFGQGPEGVMRVSATGGKPETVVIVKAGETAHGPQMLPGGQSVLFTLALDAGADRWDRAKVLVQTLKTGARKTLVEAGSDGRYLPTGHIVFAISGVLFAVPFDLRRLQVTGGPVPILEGVRRGAATGTAQFSVSDTGTLMYVPGAVSTTGSQSDVGLFDRQGGAQLLKFPPAPYEQPRVSPDGKQIALGSDDGKDAIVWVYDLSAASSIRRLTFGGRNRFPIWSADGQRVAFQSDREGDLGIFWQRADGNTPAERLTTADKGTAHIPESWSPKGDRFLFSTVAGASASLWTFAWPEKKTERFDAVQTSQSPGAVFSPDGKWVVYASRDAARNVLYVQPFPPTGAKYQVSKNDEDGHHPLWSPSGKELFFVPNPGQFVVVNVTTTPNFAVTNAVAVPRRFGISSGAFERTYDVMPDAKRFVGVTSSDQLLTGAPATPQIRIVLNWFEELKQRMPR